MNKTAVIIGAVIIFLGAGVFALTTTSDDDSSIDQTPNTSQSETTTATPANNAEKQDMIENSDQTIDMVMSNFKYSQDTITASPGDIVTINLSVASGSHDFVIDELNVQSEVIGSSGTDTITFTVPEDAAGQSYSFYCSIGNHRAQGMEGELVISG